MLIAAAPSTKNKEEKLEESLDTPVTWHIAMRPGKRKVLPKITEGELLQKIEHTKASSSVSLI
ncbi:MAG: hypothetical protein DID89_2727547067 [Candidatus Nitrotoga sp. CP45]|nr:MAG: hypothetical protein DID89_2727547067 [Candidatus Nitrotoga sp. CP45]